MQDGLAGELPVQPSSLASPSMQLPLASETAIAEPIPSTEVPAASPLADRRQKRTSAGSAAKWWPVALFLAVLATIGALAASKGDDREVGPADRTGPGSPVAPR